MHTYLCVDILYPKWIRFAASSRECFSFPLSLCSRCCLSQCVMGSPGPSLSLSAPWCYQHMSSGPSCSNRVWICVHTVGGGGIRSFILSSPPTPSRDVASADRVCG